MSMARTRSTAAMILTALLASGCGTLLARAPGGEVLLDVLCPAPATPAPAPIPSAAPAPPPETRALAPPVPVRIVLRGVKFTFDRAEISGVSRVVLDAGIDALSRYPNLRIEISGHTDSTGDASYNQGLSERRARAVADYMISKGIAASRLRVVGYGEGQPIADNSTHDGRAQNRRTELKILH